MVEISDDGETDEQALSGYIGQDEPFLTQSFHRFQLAGQQRMEGSLQPFRRSTLLKPTSQWRCRNPSDEDTPTHDKYTQM